MVPQTAEIQPTVLVRIGAIESPEEEVFGRIRDLAVSPEGNVYILDQQACQVRVFGPDGGFQFQFGQEGEGPGEFQTLSGQHIDSSLLIRSLKQSVQVGDGRFAVLKSGSVSLRSIQPTESLLLVGPSSTDTLRAAPSADLFVRLPKSSWVLKSPLCGLLHFSPAPDGALVVATGEDGFLSKGRWDLEEWVWEESVQVAPAGVPLTDQDYDDLLSLVPERDRPNATRDHLTTTPIKSAVCGLEVGTDGMIWLRLVDRDDRESWVAHDPSSFRPLAHLFPPAGVALKGFGSGTGFGVWKDDLGVDYVVVYDIHLSKVPGG
jgi:hypothetical protein